LPFSKKLFKIFTANLKHLLAKRANKTENTFAELCPLSYVALSVGGLGFT
jgi:hypothetical protein